MTDIITIDYETFYSAEYTLRAMTPAEYILDPRFEALGAAFKVNDEPSYWVDGPDLLYAFSQFDWSRCVHASHNAGFDAAISSWLYHIQPGLWIDTLAMARPTIYPTTGSVSLDACAKHLGLPAKGSTVHKLKGYRLADIKASPSLHAEMVDYATHDADLCRGIYLALKANFPADEFIIMDMVVRMVAQPQFRLNQNVLHAHLQRVEAAKQVLLDRLGMEDAVALMSNDKFADMLIGLGVTPPIKISATTGKRTWAFSKTDQEFLELQEHDSPEVQALMAARFGHKSTLEETRTRRLISIGNLLWPDQTRGRMPVPLRYSGAHTHRLSGDWKINLQNLPRKTIIDQDTLRDAFEAGPGWKVITADSAQVEARLTAWFCGQQDLVNAFASGEDIYSNFASEIFHFPVSKKTHPVERFIGKQSILGLGFGVGDEKFDKTIPILSRNQLGYPVHLQPGQAKGIVSFYRHKYRNIAHGWTVCESLIHSMHSGSLQSLGVVFTRQNELVLPNGMRLTYTDLEPHTSWRQRPDGTGYEQRGWRYRHGKTWKTLYGAKLLENIIQALARILTMGAAVEMRRNDNTYTLALQVHDELVYVVRDEDVEWFAPLLREAMKTTPSWADGLPLEAEIGVGQSYGAAK